MTDGDLVANDAGGPGIDVEDGTVLNIRSLPDAIGATSPRMAALNQMLESAPMSTSPITTSRAPGRRQRRFAEKHP